MPQLEYKQLLDDGLGYFHHLETDNQLLSAQQPEDDPPHTKTHESKGYHNHHSSSDRKFTRSKWKIWLVDLLTEFEATIARFFITSANFEPLMIKTHTCDELALQTGVSTICLVL
jgi:hypothetical protein